MYVKFLHQQHQGTGIRTKNMVIIKMTTTKLRPQADGTNQFLVIRNIVLYSCTSSRQVS